MTRVVGYPIRFDVDSVDLGGFIEVIRPSAFARTLDEGLDVVALRNHDSNFPLGRTSAKTLTLHTDSRGVSAQLDVDEDVSFVGDLLRMIRRGDATGGSFAFSVVDDVFSLRHGIPFREILDMRVREISVGVPFPAYESTRLSVEGGTRQQSIGHARRRLKQTLVNGDIQAARLERQRLINSRTRPRTSDPAILKAWHDRRMAQ